MTAVAVGFGDFVLGEEHKQLVLRQRTQYGIGGLLIGEAVISVVQVGVVVERNGKFRLGDRRGLTVVGDGRNDLRGVAVLGLDENPAAAGEHADDDGNQQHKCE